MNQRHRLLLVIILTFLAVIYILPNFYQYNKLPSSKINLGLDLNGGAHLLLKVDFNNYLRDQCENLSNNIKRALRNERLGYRHFSFSTNNITFMLRNSEEMKAVQKVVKEIDPDLTIEVENDRLKLYYDQTKLTKLEEQVLAQSIEVVRMRVDAQGTKEPTLQKQGQNHILLQVPGIENPQALKNLLGQTAKLSFHLVAQTANSGQENRNIKILPMKASPEHTLPIEASPILTGDLLSNANTAFDNYSKPAVAFTFNARGTKIFAEVTKQNSGRPLAIVLDNQILSAPVIHEPILAGSGIISGNFTVETANELAILLKAGSLPAPLQIIEERNVGPSLGADSITASKKAGIIGFSAVIISMILCYGMLGVFAGIALSATILYIFALLSLLNATLTLPGIAGIILTIGMAVDANILIYERIREELKHIKTIPFAVQQGFREAFSTIADSNITTLIVALLLYIFGVGAVRGFAVTLTLGIISSMFAAIVITKLLLEGWVKYFKPKTIGLE